MYQDICLIDPKVYKNPGFSLYFLLIVTSCLKWKVRLNINSSHNPIEEGNGTPLQYSCLENSMDGGAWWAAVHGIAESRARLSDFTFIFMDWRRKWQPTPVLLPGESQGRESLVGCRLWGRTESDTTRLKWLSGSIILKVYKNPSFSLDFLLIVISCLKWKVRLNINSSHNHIFQIWLSRWTYLMLLWVSNKILGWPKGSFKFFRKIAWMNKLWANSIYLFFNMIF